MSLPPAVGAHAGTDTDVAVPQPRTGTTAAGEPERFLSPSRLASLLSTVGQEITTAVLAPFFVKVLDATPLVVAGVEAAAHAGGAVARFGGAEIAARRPARRSLVSLVGHVGMGLASVLLAASSAVWQASVFRVGSWVARGLRTPLRPGQASEVTASVRMGSRLGVERSVDALGASVGPMLAMLLLTFVGVRTVILLAVVPAVVAVAVSAANALRPGPAVAPAVTLPPIRERMIQLRRGPLGRLMLGVAIYEASNIAAVLLLLRATKLLPDGVGPLGQLQAVAMLYVVYHLSAAACAVWAGAVADRVGAGVVMANGAVCLLAAYAGFAYADRGEVPLIVVCFVLAGASAGAVDAAEYTGVGRLASPEARWTAFGTLAALQSAGRTVATLTAGALWTFIAPEAGLLISAPLLVATTILFTLRTDRPADRSVAV